MVGMGVTDEDAFRSDLRFMGIGPQTKVGKVESDLVEFDTKLRHA